MRVSRYRLTGLGKLGAILFIAPTPIAAYYLHQPELNAFQKRLQAAGSPEYNFTPNFDLLVLLGVLSLVGVVLLLIGREIITTDG
ncbi:hypothetical protein QE408_000706 [Agrobacterium larrymoorei]|uniref:Uncharacterized protein n=1 Tax=Agrobacterium larrymoorei TaxID=160699 RepID=A0ABU0UF88_9HYPH|nr:hypothetical protein [Agrobacterium larrymoorei]